jgi:hypothetical protein
MHTQIVLPDVNPYLKPLLQTCGLNFQTEFYLIILVDIILPDDRKIQVILNNGGCCTTPGIHDYRQWRCTTKRRLEEWLENPVRGQARSVAQHQVLSCFTANNFGWSSGGRMGSDGLWVNGRVIFGISGRGRYLKEVAEKALYRAHLFSTIAESLLAAKMAIIKK